MIGLVRFYQKYLSGLKGYSSCKYFPTCSQYAIEAIEKLAGSGGDLRAAGQHWGVGVCVCVSVCLSAGGVT